MHLFSLCVSLTQFVVPPFVPTSRRHRSGPRTRDRGSLFSSSAGAGAVCDRYLHGNSATITPCIGLMSASDLVGLLISNVSLRPGADGRGIPEADAQRLGERRANTIFNLGKALAARAFDLKLGCRVIAEACLSGRECISPFSSGPSNTRSRSHTHP